MRILLMAADTATSRAVSNAFFQNGDALDRIDDVEDALSALAGQEYDAVIVDAEPAEPADNCAVRAIRASMLEIPVIALTSSGDSKGRIRCLDRGADDCLARPFDMEELLARVRAITRRRFGHLSDMIEFGDLRFDRACKMAWIGDRVIRLTPKEISTLEALLDNVGKPVHKERIYQRLYGFDLSDVGISAVEVYVGRVRKKIRDSRTQIETIHNYGYQMVSSRANEAGAAPHKSKPS